MEARTGERIVHALEHIACVLTKCMQGRKLFVCRKLGGKDCIKYIEQILLEGYSYTAELLNRQVLDALTDNKSLLVVHTLGDRKYLAVGKYVFVLYVYQ